jgi:hypothetical protein
MRKYAGKSGALEAIPSQQVSEGPKMVAFQTNMLSSLTGAAEAP